MSAPELRQTVTPGAPTHVCLDCGALGHSGGYHRHWEDAVGETVALADLPDVIRALTRFEGELAEAEGEIARLRKQTEQMAAQLALTVRWGMGPNLQSVSARKFLEGIGYTLDGEGWLEGEAGYGKGMQR